MLTISKDEERGGRGQINAADLPMAEKDECNQCIA